MEFSEKRWYVGWFFLSLQVVDRFRDKDGLLLYMHQDGTNLCQFMRVTLIWAPLIVLLHLAVYGLILAALILVPLKLFGVLGTLTIVGVIALVLVAFIALVFLIVGAKELSTVIYDAASDLGHTLQERRQMAAARRVEKGPGYASIVWQYAVAVKRRICPIITFKHV